MSKAFSFLPVSVLLIPFLAAAPSLAMKVQPTGEPLARLRPVLARTPYHFEPNLGQTDPSVQFLARAGNFQLFLTAGEWIATSGESTMRLRLQGSSHSPWRAERSLPGISSYFIGRDSTKWIKQVPNFAGIRRTDVYPKIDLLISGAQHRIEYQFHLAPHADPSQIRFAFEDGVPTIDPAGSLSIATTGGEFVHSAPQAYQFIGGKRVRVPIVFELQDDAVAFRLGAYNPTLPLVIDPVLAFHNFHGGATNDTSTAAAPDSEGNLYYTGWTASLNFPVAGSPYHDFNSGRRDLFVARIAPAGNFIFSTYVGGSGDDMATSIAVDPFNWAYVAGTTDSSNLPTTTESFQQNYGGGGDGFFLKISPTGFQTPSVTYLGGAGYDLAQGVVSDSNGSAFVTGYTASPNFPTRNPRQATFGGGIEDMFLAKFHPNGSDVIFSTFFGGEGDEEAHAMSIDAQGNPLIAGRGTCSAVPIGSRIGPGGGVDLLIMKWRGNGDGALYITCIGGASFESAHGIAADAAGNAFVTGFTSSFDFPVVAPLQLSFGGAQSGTVGDAFLFKLNAAGNQLVYSTYLGGVKDDYGMSVRVNSQGEAFVAGNTKSQNFPFVGSGQPSPTNLAGFLVRVAANGLSMLGTWFFDGVNEDDRFSVAIDSKDNVYLTGGAAPGIRLPSSKRTLNFTSPLQDALIVKLAFSRLQVYQDTFSPVITSDAPFELVHRVLNRGPEASDNVTFRGLLPAGLTTVSCIASGVTCSITPNSYRVDLAQLPAGAGFEVRISLRLTANALPGQAQVIQLSSTADNFDSYLDDNSTTTTLFSAQPGTACNYALTSQSFSVPSNGGFFGVDVSAPFSCPWSTTKQTSWITLISPSAASGPGNLSVSIPANTTPVPRMGSVIIAGQRVLFLQKAAGNVQPVFTDVPATHPFYDFISLLRAEGITQGCSTTEYCPEGLTSRAQMAAFLIRALLGSEDFTFAQTPFFSDVPATHPLFRYVQKLRELGITAGCSASTYCPEDPVTRSQMALFVVRAKLAVAPSQSFPYPSNFSFVDVPGTAFAYPAVLKMKELGITTGCTFTAYCPDDFTTRGQMSAFLIRAFLAP